MIFLIILYNIICLIEFASKKKNYNIIAIKFYIIFLYNFINN